MGRDLSRALVAARPQPRRLLADGTPEPRGWLLGVEDRVALEAALDVASEVVAVGLGGAPARRSVRSALERGADRGLHVAFEPIDDIAGDRYADVLARVADREAADAVVVGERAALAGPEVAGLAASRLGWPSATGVTALGVDGLGVAADVGPDELAVQRRLATGRQEAVAVRPPVVLGIDSGFANPERAPLDTLIEGRRAAIETVQLAEVAPGESRFSMSVGRATVDRVTPNERWGRGSPPREGTVEERLHRLLGRDADDATAPGERVDAPPEEAAERVVAYLRQHDLL